MVSVPVVVACDPSERASDLVARHEVAEVVTSHRQRSAALPLSTSERVLGCLDLPEERRLEVSELIVSSVEGGGLLDVGLSSLLELVNFASEAFSFGGERFEFLAILFLDNLETGAKRATERRPVAAAGGLGRFEEVAAPRDKEENRNQRSSWRLEARKKTRLYFELLLNSSTSASVRSLSVLSFDRSFSNPCMSLTSSLDLLCIESCLFTSASISDSLAV